MTFERGLCCARFFLQRLFARQATSVGVHAITGFVLDNRWGLLERFNIHKALKSACETRGCATIPSPAFLPRAKGRQSIWFIAVGLSKKTNCHFGQCIQSTTCISDNDFFRAKSFEGGERHLQGDRGGLRRRAVPSRGGFLRLGHLA